MKIITIPGPPVPKARAWQTKSGHIYTPQRTINYERLVKKCYKEQVGDVKAPTNMPVAIQIRFFVPIPRTDPEVIKQEKRTAKLRPTKPGDVDNYAKSVFDALNGVAYADDSQVVQATIDKYYSDEPRTIVVIKSAAH